MHPVEIKTYSGIPLHLNQDIYFDQDTITISFMHGPICLHKYTNFTRGHLVYILYGV